MQGATSGTGITFNHRLVVSPWYNFEGPVLHVALDQRVLELAPNQTLDVVHCVPGVDGRLQQMRLLLMSKKQCAVLFEFAAECVQHGTHDPGYSLRATQACDTRVRQWAVSF